MTTRTRIGFVVAGVAAAALCVALAASAQPQAPQKTKLVMGFIPAVIANPAQQAINNGFKNQARKLGMTPVTLGGEFNPQAQITAVNAAIQRRVNALAIWPLDPKGIRPSLDRARKAGIRIFTIWTKGLPGATMNVDYAEAPAGEKVARLAAAQAKKDGKSCKVGIIQGLPIVPILKARNDALEAGAKKAGCQILEKQVNEKDSADGALPIVQAWKTKWGSDMTVVLAYNDPSALGAVAASTGNFSPVITGMNADPAALDAIRAGKMLATTTIPNPEMGNTLAFAAYQLLAKHKRPPRNASGAVQVVTKSNVNRYVPWSVRNKRALQVSFVKKGKVWFFRTKPDYTLKP